MKLSFRKSYLDRLFLSYTKENEVVKKCYCYILYIGKSLYKLDYRGAVFIPGFAGVPT